MIASSNTRATIWLLSLGFLTFAFADSAFAQRGRGGRGGFDRSSPFRMLSDDDIQDELKLTDGQEEQIKKLEEAAQAEASLQPPPQFPQNGTEADRAAFFAQMRKQQEDRSNAAMAKIKDVLQPEQYQRLEQLRLQNIGLRALGSEQIAADLKLSDKQKDDLSKLLEEYQGIRFNFSIRGEEKEKQTEEMAAKIMAVLTPEQKTAWEAKLGPSREEGDDRSTPATTTAGNTSPAAPTTSRPSYTPPQNDGPVVVSLGGSQTGENGTEKAPAKSDTPPSKEKSIRFHLENAPWEMVLTEFARKADLTLQILDLPPGSLTYTNDDRWYTPTEALDILHGYLLQMGFVMIQRDRFLVILDIDNTPIPPNLIPNISLSDLETEGKYGKHTLLNVVLPLEGAEANEAAREVEALKGPQGSVVPLSVSNSLVVTDTFANLKRIHNLLKGVTNVDPEALQFKSFPLKHIVAEEAAVIVRDQLGLAASTSSSDSRSRFPFGFQFGGRDSRGGSSSRSTPAPATATAKVTPDPRTNSLLVTATKNDLAIAEQILTTIDIEADSGLDSRPYLHVYHLKKADVDEVQRTLDNIMPGLVVGEDEDRDGGRIHVKATPRQHEQIAELIAKMDGTATQSTAVIPIASLDPLAVSTMLNGMFASDGDSAPTIMADTSGRRLMVRGSSDQINEIKLFLKDLGANGTETANGQNRGPMRIYPLGGRDAEEFVRILEQVWNNNSTTPIRVVIPSNNPIRERSIPSMEESFPLETPATQLLRPRRGALDPKSTSLPPKPFYPVSLEDEKPEPARAETPAEDAASVPETVTLRIGKTGEMTLDGKTTSTIQISKWAAETQESDRQLLLSIHPETPAVKFAPIIGVLDRSDIRYTMKMSAEEETIEGQPVPKTNAQSQAAPSKRNQPTVTTRNGKLPITVTVRGGELMLYDLGGTGEELDEMEGMIEQLALAIPPRTTWTVYYLRSADVTETAVMLEQLFPSSSVSSDTYDDGSFFGGLTSSLTSLGGSLADASGFSSLTQSPTTLRIIPELRSNSLFVSGPADQVRQVEQMLKVLDADDLPETLRDRVPRMIPVEYANVNDVAAIVRDVYKDFLEDPRQNQGRQNPLAAMMGGGGSNGRSSRGSNAPSTVKMTIGVDAQTSKLVVSASDSLFQQVKEMVEDLDKSAFEARRTVQILNVNEASSVVLQQALTAMLPNVSVSTTSSSTSRGSSNGQPSFGGNDNNSNDDDRRAPFEAYMRSRSGGDSGSSRWGSSSRGDSGSSRWGSSSRGDSSRSSRWGGSSRGGDSGRGGFSGWGRGGDSSRGRGR